MAIVRKGSKWQVRVRDLGGEWFPYQSFDTKVEAREHEGKLLDLRARGGIAAAKLARSMTFDDYWKRWSTECRVGTSDGWVQSQNQMYRDHILPTLGKHILAEIEREDILAVLKSVKKKGLGQQSQLHVFNLMHQMFDDAIQELGLLDKQSPVRRSLKPFVRKAERSFMKPDEAYRFLDFVAQDYIGPAIWLMTYCGLRVGEAQALQWKHIDLQSGSLMIARQFNRKEKRILEYPKNKQKAHISMPEALVEYLAARKPLEVDPDSYVVRAHDGGMLSYNTIYKAMLRLCKAGNFTMITPHECRHTCSELWLEIGAQKEDLRRLYNHKSSSSTETYIHAPPESLQRLSKRVGRREHLKVVK
jgi:integrase